MIVSGSATASASAERRSPFRVVPRTEIGLPAVVRSSTGALRPPLHLEPWLTWHYTGVNTVYRGRDVPAQVRHIQAIFEDSKPFEYNYVIGQTEDDAIYEFAGKFRAAHSGGENDLAFGILFLNGVGEPLTDTQIRKAQWLRDVLIFDGALQPKPIQEPHQRMPGAATACPGPLIMSVLDQLAAPFVESEPPVEDDMSSDYFLWRHRDYKNVFLVGGGGVVHLDRQGMDYWLGKGVEFIDDSAHDGVFASYVSIAQTTAVPR